MKKRDNDSRKVSRKVANKRKRKAKELFTASSPNADRLDASCEQAVRKVCKRVLRQFKAPTGYSLKDLVNDVIVKILSAKEPYRGECEIDTFVFTIARNHMRTLSRRSARCMSLEDLIAKRTECRNNEERSEADLLDHLLRAQTKIHRNDIEDHEFYLIAGEEFLALLTDQQRLIWQLLEEGYTVTDIALILGVSPQAVSRTKGRIDKKLMTYVNSPKEKVFAKCP